MDTELFFLINGHHNQFFDAFFYEVSQKTVWIPLYVALLYAVWRNYSWRGVLGILLMVGIGMLFTDWANSHFLRPWIGRLRPSNPENPIAMLVHIVHNKRGGGYGFPSCHSANIWLLTFLVAHWLRQRLMTITMLTIALLWCYSRVYLGYHYPGDILGGFILATIVAYAITIYHTKRMRFTPLTFPHSIWVPVIVASTTIICFLLHALVQVILQ